MPEREPLLKVENLTVQYGAIRALRGVSFEVGRGEIITLIGSNGAGKSTTLNGISNIVRKAAGRVLFDGEDITALPPDRVVKAGLVQSPEGRRVFANLTVRDNLEMGAYTQRDRAKTRANLDRVLGLFPRLRERFTQTAGTLSGGEQQMLAMGRALMASPRLLLLDEPSMGLAPILVDEIFAIIRQINQDGAAILLVEQNAYKALSLASRACVLETGEIIKSGLSADLMKDDTVRKAYLGG
ncbi:MAG: branched-chain amino acid ABC transporter [Treponematales bacterium]|jgi:branched-chain amino acid transport system ATP-binding protein